MSVPKLPQLKADAKRAGWAKYIRTAADEAALLAGYRFDLAAAQRVEMFFNRFLRHSKGQWAGQPFELLPWQREELIHPLFGWLGPDGRRRFRVAFVFLPKKNSKSTIAAGIGLYMLAGDGEMGAEIYSAATDASQASIIHREAINMVEASPALSRALTVNHSSKTIVYPGTRSRFSALSAEAANKEGLNASCITADELHVWRGRKLYDCLKFAGAARRQPLLFQITTAGDDPLSVCYQQWEYASLILRGELTGEDAIRFFPLLKQADPEDDIDSPRTWHKANPSLGVIFQESDFRADLEEAKQSPSALAAFKRYRLNVWQSSTNPAIAVEDWEACAMDYTEEDLVGRECVAALDFATRNDMASLVLLFPDGEEAAEGLEQPEPQPGETPPDADQEIERQIEQALALRQRFRCLAWFFVPEATAYDRRNPNGPKYREWIEKGLLVATPGNETDFGFIRRKVCEALARYQVKAAVYDPTFAPAFMQDLEDRFGLRRVEFPQTVSHFAGPCVAFERAVLGHRFGHNRHPILTWHIGNLNFKANAVGYKRPAKPIDGDARKIDGAVCSIMAIMGATNPEIIGSGSSVYDRGGIELL